METVLNILPVFLVIFLGSVSKRLGFFPETFLKGANRLVFYIGVPALLFIKVSHASFHEAFDVRIVLVSCLSILIVWLFCVLFVKAWNITPLAPSLAASFIQTSMHGNIGYIDLAMVLYALGNHGLSTAGFVAPFIIVSHNLLSVLSFKICSGMRQERAGSFKDLLATVVSNPIIVSSTMGIVFSFFGLKMPDFANRFLEIVASMALPIGLLIVGASLSLSRISENLPWLFFSSVIKLLLLPGIGLGLLHYMGTATSSIAVAVTLLGAPAGTVSVIMASEMKGDVMFASSAITLSTLLSGLSYYLWGSVIR
ncbi:MAG: AEC family transporter [Desulfobacteraceae bacterium]|nr:AEC family transporter [Desulfobacteraceae bacterium]